MTINQYNGTHNLSTTTRGAAGIKYIAIHYVCGTTSKAGAARNVCDWFANSACAASCDFAVDDEQAWQYNPTPETRYTWQIGGNASSYSKDNSLAKSLLGVAKNSNSIGIEICNRKSASGDYYFTDEALATAAELCRYLMEKYHIAADHVIMHNMVTGKQCPIMWTKNEAALQGWYDFKTRLEDDDMTQAQTQALIDGATKTFTTQITALSGKVQTLEQENASLKKQLSALTTITGTGDNPSAWAKGFCQDAVKRGLFTGSDGDYGWQTAVTREQLATVLWRLE